jgi:hypothetical protein
VGLVAQRFVQAPSGSVLGQAVQCLGGTRHRQTIKQVTEHAAHVRRGRILPAWGGEAKGGFGASSTMIDMLVPVMIFAPIGLMRLQRRPA